MGCKQLELDFYVDGLSEVEFNCLDIPIAATCGYYGKENYYLYLMQLCVNRNWERFDKSKKNMFDCLRNLGLEMVPIEICDGKQLIEEIKEQIDRGYPVLLPVTYFEMFFCSRYQRSKDSHYLIVDGYVEEHEILLLREEINFISSEQLKHNRGLYQLRLKYNMVEEMWELSKKDIDKRFLNRIFIIRPLKELAVKITNYEDFLQDILDNYDLHKSYFVKDILARKPVEGTLLEQQMICFRSDYYKYMYALFYLIQCYIVDKVNSDVYLRFQELKNAYLQEREIAISKYHIGLLKKKNHDFAEIVRCAEEYDQRLNYLFYEIKEQLLTYKEKLSQEESSNLTSDVRDIMVTASSCESEILKHPKNVLIKDDSIWKSAPIDKPHWICFDFQHPTELEKIIITHHAEGHKLTKDFCIEGSMDGHEWSLIEKIENNLQEKTIHDLRESCYQYLRIYITLPALRKNTAIIRNVSIVKRGQIDEN